jgi:hypothetical protein
MDEIETMKAIAEKLEKLSGEERGRVLNWAASKYGLPIGPASPPVPAAAPASHSHAAASPKASPPSTNGPKSKTSKKAKSIIAMDKSLNLSPSGKVSAADFASGKAPQNVMQKCVVAVYYLRDTIEMESVTVSAVYTFFKTLGWPIPSDLRNTLQQAGTKGWLDTKDGEDIKLTSMGENLVEQSLPPKPKG